MIWSAILAIFAVILIKVELEIIQFHKYILLLLSFKKFEVLRCIEPVLLSNLGYIHEFVKEKN